MALLDEYDVWISALATHNTPIHLDDEIANEADTELRETIEVAGQLGVDTVTCFSRLPAGSPNDNLLN